MSAEQGTSQSSREIRGLELASGPESPGAGPLGRERRRARWVTALAGVALAFALVAAPLRAVAHEHDPEQSGHPVRILAYLLHPVGVILDYVIFRPAHWIVSYEPFQTLFGHEEDDDY